MPQPPDRDAAAAPQRLIVRPFALYAVVALYDRITASPYPADRLMQTFFKERKQLGKRDRGFVAETVYGMLRNRRWLEWAFPDLDTMHRALAYLALHEPGARLPLEPEDEAQLRRAVAGALEKPPPDDPVEAIALTHSMPDWMVAIWHQQYGPEETAALCKALNQAAPLVIRTNTLKTTREALQDRLREAGHDSVPTPTNPDGLIITQKANLFATPAF
ncbi:MAG: RsmB/NOP family class I SAM-dependent RNA methyltransferase, partial [Rhodothermales bacterium]